MNAWLEKMISVPKTIYVNLKCFSFKEALKFRVSVSYRVRCQNLRKGCIEFISPSGKLNIGFSNGSFNMGRGYKGSVSFGKNGRLIIKDKAYLPAGVLLNCNGIISLGSNFESNARLLISCEKRISIGDNPAIGWDVSIIDGDGHDIFKSGVTKKDKINLPKEITIGNHVWLCAKCTVLKGAVIGDDSVVGFGAVVSKAYRDNHVLVAGSLSRIVKTDIDWDR